MLLFSIDYKKMFKIKLKLERQTSQTSSRIVCLFKHAHLSENGCALSGCRCLSGNRATRHFGTALYCEATVNASRYCFQWSRVCLSCCQML